MPYPSAIDSFTTLLDNVDYVLAAHPNDRATAITNIETALGTYMKNVLFPNYCSYFTAAPDAGDTIHDIAYTAFECRNDADSDNITVAALTKRFDATFAAGTGNGGMQSGSSLSASKGYLVYAISDTTRVNSGDLMAVPQGTAFAYPTGYDEKKLVSFFRTDGSSQILDFTQTGQWWWYGTWPTLASGNVGASAFVSIDITEYVPTLLSSMCFGSMRAVSSTETAISNKSTGDPLSTGVNEIASNSSTTEENPWMLNVITANTLYWGGSSASSYIQLSGFYMNKLR